MPPDMPFLFQSVAPGLWQANYHTIFLAFEAELRIEVNYIVGLYRPQNWWQS
jgi:hypothetical protein